MRHHGSAEQRGGLLTTNPAQLSEDGIQGWRETEGVVSRCRAPLGMHQVGPSLEKAGGPYEQLSEHRLRGGEGIRGTA